MKSSAKKKLIISGAIVLCLSILMAIICFVIIISTTMNAIEQYFPSGNINEQSYNYQIMLEDLASQSGIMICSSLLTLSFISGLAGLILLIVGAVMKSQVSPQNTVNGSPAMMQNSTIPSQHYMEDSANFKFCPNCGEEIKSENNFCPKCGCKLK